MHRRAGLRVRRQLVKVHQLPLIAPLHEAVVVPQHEFDGRKPCAIAPLRDGVQQLFVVRDAIERIELGGGQRCLVDQVDERVQVFVARHRHVPPVPIVDRAERYLVETVDVDHHVEWLANRQEI